MSRTMCEHCGRPSRTGSSLASGMSRRDFEFGNFSLSELQKILWQIAREKGARPATRKKLIENTKDAACKDELQRGARRLPELIQFSSGKEWGRRLMAFAEAHPKNEKGDDRTIVAAVRQGLMAAHGWFSHRDDIMTLQVDPETGKPVRK